jgi:hypothetical protein
MVAGYLSGCALTDYTVTSPYEPVAMARDPKPLVAALVDVQAVPSRRKSPTAVGVKKNGFGTELGTIYTKPVPRLWLAAAVKAQFEQAGIALISDSRNSVPQIRIVVEQFFVEPKVGPFAADMQGRTVVRLEIYFPKSKRTIWHRVVGEKTSSHMVWTNNDFREHLVESAQRALSQAASVTRDALVIRRPSS